MTLVESIIGYERQQVADILQELYKDDFEEYPERQDHIDFTVGVVAEQTELLATAAYNLGRSRLSEEDLKALTLRQRNAFVDAYLEIGEGERLRFIDNPKHKAAAAIVAREIISFYQELLKQSGTANIYEEAVRQRYGNVDAYRDALQPQKAAFRQMKDLQMEITGDREYTPKMIEVQERFEERAEADIFLAV